MKEINLVGEVKNIKGMYTFNISTSKRDEDSRVWLEYQQHGEVTAVEAEYDGDGKGCSFWTIKAELPKVCDCIIYGMSMGLCVSYGIMKKNGDSWIYTGEFSDYKIDIVSLKLTYNCNLKCSMCWQAKYKDQNKAFTGHMDYTNFLNTMEKLSFLAPSKIFLWGGEPLLHPNFADILKEVKTRRFMCNLITNGILLEEKTEDILNGKLDTICVSLDGLGEIHDSIRGVPGSYQRAITGLKYLLKNKSFRPIVSVNMVINDENYQYLYETVKEFESLGVNGIQIQFPVYFDMKTGEVTAEYIKKSLGISIDKWKGFIGEYSSMDIEKLDKQLHMVKSEFNNVYLYPADISPYDWFGVKESNRKINCLTAWKRLNIEPNGDVNICTDHSDMIAGNIYESRLEEIWNNRVFRSFRREAKNNNFMSMCQHCTYSYL